MEKTLMASRNNAAKINISKQTLDGISNGFNKEFAVLSFKEKFINLLMIHGKKAKASKIFNTAGNLLRKKLMRIKQEGLYISREQSKLNSHNKIKQKGLNISREQPKLNSHNKIKQKGLNISREQPKLNSHQNVGPSDSGWVASLHFPHQMGERRRGPVLPVMSSLVYQAILNVKPILEVRKVRIGRMTYQVPAIIPQKRRETLAIRWIIESARKRKTNSNLTLSECLAQELLDAFSKQGQARQKRDSLHKLAESNRASLRYRWW